MAHDDTGIRKLPKGRWEIRVSAVHPRTQTLVWVRRRITGKKYEARAKRDELREELREKLRVAEAESQPSRQRLSGYAESWLRSKALRVRRSVADRYADALAHATPFLGKLFLDDIETQDVEGWVQAMAGRETHKNTTINGWLRVVKSCIGDGRAELGLTNPAARVKPLPERSSDKEGLKVEELQALLATYTHEDTLPLVEVLARTGMRWGEASALRWEDIDRDNMRITVQRAHWRGTVDLPKNGKKRIVPMSPQLANILQRHRQRLFEEQDLGHTDGWCFATVAARGPNMGQVRLRTPSSIAKPWRKACEKAGIKASPHDLRRTFVDMIRLVGGDPMVEHEVVGHADEAMRKRYSTVRHEESASVVARIDRLVGVAS